MKNLQWGRPSSIADMYGIVCIIAFAILIVADGVEWDCAASTNTGNFTRSSDCTISGTGNTYDQGGGVDVTGTLEIVGSSTDMENLVTISAASKKRHFYVNGANDKLVLRYVKLVGGDVSSYGYPDYDWKGGSIYIVNGGELQLYSCIVSNNKAKYGGGIYVEGSSSTVKVHAENSILQGNSASYGGGMVIYGATVTLTSTTFASNSAGVDGGGMRISSSEVSLRQSSFISNTASDKGHAISTLYAPTIAVINTYFSDPNDNNNFYELSGPPTWKTCSSSSVCTEAPFTGTCSAVDSGNVKLGVNCVCATSNTFGCAVCVPGKYGVGKFNSLEGQLNEALACKDCSVGKFSNVEGQANCKDCGVGK